MSDSECDRPAVSAADLVMVVTLEQQDAVCAPAQENIMFVFLARLSLHKGVAPLG